MSTSNASTTNRPLKSFRSGAVQAAIWRNETTAGTFHSMTLSRNYKKGDDWKSAESFGPRDLVDLRRVIVAAEQFIVEQPI